MKPQGTRQRDRSDARTRAEKRTEPPGLVRTERKSDTVICGVHCQVAGERRPMELIVVRRRCPGPANAAAERLFRQVVQPRSIRSETLRNLMQCRQCDGAHRPSDQSCANSACHSTILTTAYR